MFKPKIWRKKVLFIFGGPGGPYVEPRWTRKFSFTWVDVRAHHKADICITRGKYVHFSWERWNVCGCGRGGGVTMTKPWYLPCTFVRGIQLPDMTPWRIWMWFWATDHDSQLIILLYYYYNILEARFWAMLKQMPCWHLSMIHSPMNTKWPCLDLSMPPKVKCLEVNW